MDIFSPAQGYTVISWIGLNFNTLLEGKKSETIDVYFNKSTLETPVKLLSGFCWCPKFQIVHHIVGKSLNQNPIPTHSKIPTYLILRNSLLAHNKTV